MADLMTDAAVIDVSGCVSDDPPSRDETCALCGGPLVSSSAVSCTVAAVYDAAACKLPCMYGKHMEKGRAAAAAAADGASCLPPQLLHVFHPHCLDGAYVAAPSEGAADGGRLACPAGCAIPRSRLGSASAATAGLADVDAAKGSVEGSSIVVEASGSDKATYTSGDGAEGGAGGAARGADIVVGLDIGGVIIDRKDVTGADDAAEAEDTSFSGVDFLLTDEVPGAIEGVAALKRHPRVAAVHLVSKAGDKVQARTKAWFDDQRFWERTGLHPSRDLHFCRTRDGKAPICARLGVTAFVDDRPDVLRHLWEASAVGACPSGAHGGAGGRSKHPRGGHGARVPSVGDMQLLLLCPDKGRRALACARNVPAARVVSSWRSLVKAVTQG